MKYYLLIVVVVIIVPIVVVIIFVVPFFQPVSGYWTFGYIGVWKQQYFRFFLRLEKNIISEFDY